MAQKRPDRTLGPGHDEFWNWCGKGELRIQRCATCSDYTWPVAAKCEHCGGTSLSFERMSGKGKIVSWCSFERDYYAKVLPMPWDVVLVELEEGPLFLSNPNGFDLNNVKAGEALKAAFIECEDSAGLYKLPVFEKA